MWNFTWKAVTAVILSMGVCVLIVMSSYNSPFAQTLNVFFRYPILNAIRLGVWVYDPVNISEPNMGNMATQEYRKNHKMNKMYLTELLSSSGLPNPEITIFKNQKTVYSKHPFGYTPYNLERISRLKSIYGTKLVPDDQNDFKTFLEISNYVKGLWKHGESEDFSPNNFDAIEIIKKANSGEKYWCHVYSLTFIQIASSLGFNSRLVGLSHDGYAEDHAVVESWSNYYRKWVILDVDYNLYYTKLDHGVPLNAVELHDAFLSNQIQSVTVHKGDLRPFGYDVERDETKLLQYYKYIDVDLRNDWYTNRYFRGHPNRSDSSTLFWEDQRLPAVLNLYRKISNVDEFYWTLNETEIYFELIKGNKLLLNFNTVTPNFDSWEIVLDDSSVKEQNGNRFEWELHNGENSLSIRTKNKYGLFGVESKVAINIGNLNA